MIKDAQHILFFLLTIIVAVEAISVSAHVFLSHKPFNWMMLVHGFGDGLAAVGAFVLVAILIASIR